MGEDDISARFVQAIDDAAGARNLRLGEGNQYALPEMARKAAAIIYATAESSSEQEERTRDGERAYQRLVGAMADVARGIPNYPAGVIGEQTLDLAIARIGRFPPFW